MGKKRIPEKAILSMKKKIQQLEYEEDLDEIYDVLVINDKYEIRRREK